ncbi:CHASE2 domain-containing protein [Caulobacter segnis]
MRSILKAMAASLLVGLVSFVVAKIDLFGLESATAKLYDGVYQRLTSDRYPGHDAPKGQDKIRVVYLDEVTIEAMRPLGWRSFPPTPAQQAMFLTDLAPPPAAPGAPPEFTRPAAKVLFLDFMYFGREVRSGEIDSSAFASLVTVIEQTTNYQAWKTDPTCQDSALRKLQCIIRSHGTPVILGKPHAFGQASFAPLQDRLDQIAVVVPLEVGLDTYPVIHPAGEAAPKDRFELSPALAAYAAYCLQQDDRCGDRALQAILPGAPAKARAARLERLKDMSVLWGSRSADLQKQVDEISTGDLETCRDPSVPHRLLDDAVLLRGPRSGKDGACLYTVSAGYDRLVNIVAADRRVLDTFLSGAIVMVGVRLSSGNDWIENPVQGRVAGVYYHAMALDNLMERGLARYRRTEGFIDSDFVQACLTAMMSFVGLLALLVRNELKARHEARTPPERMRAASYLTVYGLALLAWLAVLALGIWAGATIQRDVPVNWIAVAGIAAGGALFAIREALMEDLGGSLEATRSGRGLVLVLKRVFGLFDLRGARLGLRTPPPANPTDQGASS